MFVGHCPLWPCFEALNYLEPNSWGAWLSISAWNSVGLVILSTRAPALSYSDSHIAAISFVIISIC